MNIKTKIRQTLAENDFVFMNVSRQAGSTYNAFLALTNEKNNINGRRFFVSHKPAWTRRIFNWADKIEDYDIIILSFSEYKTYEINDNDCVYFDNPFSYFPDDIYDAEFLLNEIDSKAKKIWVIQSGLSKQDISVVAHLMHNDSKFKHFALVKKMNYKMDDEQYNRDILLDYKAYYDSLVDENFKLYIENKFSFSQTFQMETNRVDKTDFYICEFSLKPLKPWSINLPKNTTLSYGIDIGLTPNFNTSGYITNNGGLLSGNGELKANGLTSSGTITTNGSGITIGNSNLLNNGTWTVPTNYPYWWNQPYWQDFSLINPWNKPYQSSPVMHDKHSISIDLELSKEQYYELTSELIKNNISFSELLLKKLFDKK